MPLDDHAESLQTFEFGVASLKKLAADATRENVDKLNDLELLPKVIKDIIFGCQQDFSIPRPNHDKEVVFIRSVMHAGL